MDATDTARSTLPHPDELPDPSDSDASYWLARTLWALGEGYAAFRTRPGVRRIPARPEWIWPSRHYNRDVLGDYRTYQIIHGVRVPDWLIVDGADASSEAVLGLAAYVTARPVTERPEPPCGSWPAGIAAMSDGSTTAGPTGHCCPGRSPAPTGTPGVRTCPPRWRRPAPHWATKTC